MTTSPTIHMQAVTPEQQHRGCCRRTCAHSTRPSLDRVCRRAWWFGVIESSETLGPDLLALGEPLGHDRDAAWPSSSSDEMLFSHKACTMHQPRRLKEPADQLLCGSSQDKEWPMACERASGRGDSIIDKPMQAQSTRAGGWRICIRGQTLRT